ncbi:MAG TPA: sigma factor-like helix-turn-helix DNA-binding protein [Ureibacillus sp.]|nr:sigma factor-like helix-turn-helix DNA-binding protein [Ureibacillus sp.]
MYSIARNVTYDYIRRKKLIQFVPFLKSDVQRSLTTPADTLINKESVQELYFTIKRLKLTYQEVIILRYIQELSIEETAAILNWSISKVKSKTFIAMRKLRKNY